MKTSLRVRYLSYRCFFRWPPINLRCCRSQMAGDYLFQYLSRYKVTFRLRHYVEKPKKRRRVPFKRFYLPISKKILDFDGTRNSGKKCVRATLGITSIYSNSVISYLKWQMTKNTSTAHSKYVQRFSPRTVLAVPHYNQICT